MKYYQKRKHWILKIVILVIIGVATLFAICDCSPSAKDQEVTITYERS